MSEPKSIKVTGLSSLNVQTKEIGMVVETADGSIRLGVPPDLAAEIVHIITDGLLMLRRGEVPPKAGHLLVPGRLEPLRLETIPCALGLEEKFVLQAKSEGATSLTFRLSPARTREWIANAIAEIDRIGRTRH